MNFIAYTVRPLHKADLIDEAKRIEMDVPDHKLDSVELIEVLGVPTLRCDGVYKACDLHLPLGHYSEVMVIEDDLIREIEGKFGKAAEELFRPITTTILLSDLAELIGKSVDELIEYYSDPHNMSKLRHKDTTYRVTVYF